MHSRRRLLLALVCSLLAPLSLAKEILTVLAWEGYADPDLVERLEQQYQVEVRVTYIYSDDSLWSTFNKPEGKGFDLIALNNAELPRYTARKLLRPIDTQKINHLNHQHPRFRQRAQIPGLVEAAQTYAIPYAYSEMGLIYNRKLVSSPPDTIGALWAPEYAGKVLAFDTSNHNFTLAGISLGLADPFNQSPEQLQQSARQLVQLRRNILSIYSSPQEAVKLFKTHEIAIIYANYGSQQLKALIDAGADVGYSLPRDGTLAWLDCWAIAKQGSALAEHWINFMLSPEASDRLTNVHGLANTLDAPAVYENSRLIWLAPVENAALRSQLWDQIVAGDVLERF